MPIRLAVLLSILALMSAGCRNQPSDAYVAKPIPAVPPVVIATGDESSLMPLELGNQWVYSVQVSRKNGTSIVAQDTYDSTWKVISSTKTATGIEATIESTRKSGKPVQQKWRSDANGIYQVADGSPQVAYTPPFPVVLFPVSTGKTFKWKGTGPNGTGKAGSITSTRTIRASQVVDTEIGQMSAIPVDETGTVSADKKSANSETTIWLSPGTGIVREYQSVSVGDQGYELVLKLKSKALMKS